MIRPAPLSRAHALARRVRLRLAGARAIRLAVSLAAIGLGAAAIPLAISRLVPVSPGAAETAALAGVGAAFLLAALFAWCDRPTVAEAARRTDAAGGGRSLLLTAIAMSEAEATTPLGALFLRDLERRLPGLAPPRAALGRTFGLRALAPLLAVDLLLAATPAALPAPTSDDPTLLRRVAARLEGVRDDEARRDLRELAEARTEAELAARARDLWTRLPAPPPPAADPLEALADALARGDVDATRRAVEGIEDRNPVDAVSAAALARRLREKAAELDGERARALEEVARALEERGSRPGAGRGFGLAEAVAERLALRPADREPVPSVDPTREVLIGVFAELGQAPPTSVPGEGRGIEAVTDGDGRRIALDALPDRLRPAARDFLARRRARSAAGR